jgi:hypothetical protein
MYSEEGKRMMEYHLLILLRKLKIDYAGIINYDGQVVWRIK